MQQLFISHAGDNKPEVESPIRYLDALRYQTWMDSPLNEQLTDPPQASLSYLADLVDQVSRPDPLIQEQQRQSSPRCLTRTRRTLIRRAVTSQSPVTRRVDIDED